MDLWLLYILGYVATLALFSVIEGWHRIMKHEQVSPMSAILFASAIWPLTWVLYLKGDA